MPRPNPPRKRPRKRPTGSQQAARADAALTKQTAQSVQAKTPVPAQRPAADGAAEAVAPPPDEMWSRRSYAILIAIVALAQLPVTLIYWALQPAASNGVPKGPPEAALAVLNPISLVIACLIAAPVARVLTHERRPL